MPGIQKLSFGAFNIHDDKAGLVIRNCRLEFVMAAITTHIYAGLQAIEFKIARKEPSSLLRAFKCCHCGLGPSHRAPYCVISFRCANIDDASERNSKPLSQDGRELDFIHTHDFWCCRATHRFTKITHSTEWPSCHRVRCHQSLNELSRNDRTFQPVWEITGDCRRYYAERLAVNLFTRTIHTEGCNCLRFERNPAGSFDCRDHFSEVNQLFAISHGTEAVRGHNHRELTRKSTQRLK